MVPVVMVPKTNGLAAWSMWMGIIGLAGSTLCGLLSLIPFIGFIFSLLAVVLWVTPWLAIIFGHVARRQTTVRGEAGAGQALAGLIMGYTAVVLGIIAVLLIVVAFGGMVAFGVLLGN